MVERQFFIRQGGTVQGPFAVERVRAWIAAGRVRPDMDLSEDGTTFRPGSEFAGLFEAPAVARAGESRPPRGARPRDEGDEEPAVRPPPAPSFVVIAARLLAVIGFVVALGVGQWAHVLPPVDEAKGAAGTSRVVFGLTEFTTITSKGGQVTRESTTAYGAVRPVEGGVGAGPKAEETVAAAGTSRTLGWVIGGLVVLAALLVAASFGGAFGNPRLSVLATFGLLASALAAIGGWVFPRMGLAGLFAREPMRAGATSSAAAATAGGFSLYTVILGLLLLGIAEAKSRVASVDDSRRRKVRRRPKRR